MSAIVFGAMGALLSLLGLAMASGARDVGVSIFGMGMFLFGFIFVFFLVKRHFDAEDAARAAARGRH